MIRKFKAGDIVKIRNAPYGLGLTGYPWPYKLHNGQLCVITKDNGYSYHIITPDGATGSCVENYIDLYEST